MDVRFSPEMHALRDSATQIVGRLGPKSVRDLGDTERTAKLDAAVDSSGWRELRAAADGRTPVASGIETAIVAEELGRGLAEVAFLGPTMAADLRRLVEAPAATSPETVVLLPDLSAVAVAERGVTVEGALAIDAGSPMAGLILQPAAGGWALAQVSVPAGRGDLDLTRSVTTVDTAGAVPVADAARVLSPEDLDGWTALGLALACADLVGVMRGAIDLAAEYAATRRQYGVRIGSFQAVQHLLADAFVAMEGSRSVALHAAWAVDARPPDEALAAASVAKAYCARAGRSVGETAIQVHGGIGNTWECLAHVYLRRALLSIDLLGGVGPSLARVLDSHGLGGEYGLR